MNLDRLNQWLILAANLGVLIGIIILSMEIRQNTVAIRGTAIQTAATLTRDQMYWMAGDPELSRIAVTGMESPSDLDPVEGLYAAVTRSRPRSNEWSRRAISYQRPR